MRPGLTAERLNDDSLGRALDLLYEAGLTKSLPRWLPMPCVFAASYRSALPLWIQALDGNASDTHAFPQVVEAYLGHLQEGEMPYLAADSAPYSEENLQRLRQGRWLTRVPERISRARGLIEAVSAADMQPAGQEGYHYLELGATYGEVRQRWLVIGSEQAEQRERATLHKQVRQEREKAEQAWKSLGRHEFASREAAEEAVGRLTGEWASHQLEVCYREVAHYGHKGRPASGTVPQRVGGAWRRR